MTTRLIKTKDKVERVIRRRTKNRFNESQNDEVARKRNDVINIRGRTFQGRITSINRSGEQRFVVTLRNELNVACCGIEIIKLSNNCYFRFII